jgi:hypothetical protein
MRVGLSNSPQNPPTQDWNLLDAGISNRTFNDLVYLPRTNPSTSNQIIFSPGFTAHQGGSTVVTSNTVSRILHNNDFVNTGTHSNFQCNGIEYHLDAKETNSNVNSFSDEAYMAGVSWVSYSNSTNTSTVNGYTIGKIFKRTASPTSANLFTEILSEAGLPFNDIKSNKKYNGNVILAGGTTARSSFSSTLSTLNRLNLFRSGNNGTT